MELIAPTDGVGSLRGYRGGEDLYAPNRSKRPDSHKEVSKNMVNVLTDLRVSVIVVLANVTGLVVTCAATCLFMPNRC